MKAAVEAVSAAQDARVRLLLDGDDLLLEAPSQLPPDVIDLLREKKAEIVALLRSAGGDWSAENWQIFHDEKAAVARCGGGQTEAAAQEVAFESCVADWLRRHPSGPIPGGAPGAVKPSAMARRRALRHRPARLAPPCVLADLVPRSS